MDPLEFTHVYTPNIWNPVRGVPPLAAMAMELEQDWSVNRETIKRLNSSAIPQGILKTEQRLTEPQAKELQDRWEQKYGRSKGDKRIAVIGQGTSFQALNENLLQYFDVSDRNKVSILTKYGIPLKVANATTEKTALSGKDSNEQYKALWSQTLIPVLKFWESEIKVQLLNRFGLEKYRIEFDLSQIPELQEDEADLQKRLRENIAGGLMTPNEARDVIHYDPLPEGETLQLGKKADDKKDGKEGDDVPDEEGEPDKSVGGRTISIFQGPVGDKRGDDGLSRFFNLVREG